MGYKILSLMIKYLTPLILTIMLAACELVIDIDPPDFESSIVFNSILQPDSTIQVVLSKDYYILDNQLDDWQLTGLKGARITMFEDDLQIGVLNEIDYTNQWGEEFSGYYTLDYQPKVGSEYRFEVSKSGYNSIEVSERLPDYTPDIDLNLKDTTVDEWGSSKIRVNMKIEDVPGDNYYELVVFEQYTASYYDDFLDSLISYDASYEIYIESQSLLVSEYQQKFLFTDDLFKDTSYELEFEFYYSFYDEPIGDGGEQGENPRYLIYQIRNCSKAYYQYYNSAALHFWNSDNPFAEPVHVYSNVENGYGLLGSFLAVTDTLAIY
jgi:hypothetical protein